MLLSMGGYFKFPTKRRLSVEGDFSGFDGSLKLPYMFPTKRRLSVEGDSSGFESPRKVHAEVFPTKRRLSVEGDSGLRSSASQKI